MHFLSAVIYKGGFMTAKELKKTVLIALFAAFSLSCFGAQAATTAPATANKISKSDFKDIKITHGPWVHSLTDTSAIVLWTTDTDAVSWVEIAPDDGSHFYERERKKFYQSPLGKKAAGTLHAVKVDGLKPDTLYNYRVFSKKVMFEQGEATYYGFTASTRVYHKEPLKFRTLGSAKKEIKFSVLNDTHERVKYIKNMLAVVPEKTDFLLLNGDMVSNIVSREAFLSSFVDDFAAFCANGTPMFYVRGNHETRGVLAKDILDYFPTDTNKTYYTFKVGQVMFVVLDSGEDKPDNDIEYFDRADFDNFREHEAEWFKNVVASKEFKEAPVKILISHIPPAWGNWHGSKHFQKYFAETINGAGFSLILSGHLHKHEFYAASDLIKVPNVVNSNKEMLNVKVDEKKIEVSFVNEKGEKARDTMVFDVK